MAKGQQRGNREKKKLKVKQPKKPATQASPFLRGDAGANLKTTVGKKQR